MDAASQGFNKATANQPSSVGDDVVSASKKSMSPFYRLPSFFSLPFLFSSPLLFHIVVLLFASTKPSLRGQDLWLQHVHCIFSGFPSSFPFLFPLPLFLLPPSLTHFVYSSLVLLSFSHHFLPSCDVDCCQDHQTRYFSFSSIYASSPIFLFILLLHFYFILIFIYLFISSCAQGSSG